MGHSNGPGSRASRVCRNPHASMRKYSLMCSSQCFRNNAKAIGFIKCRWRRWVSRKILNKLELELCRWISLIIWLPILLKKILRQLQRWQRLGSFEMTAGGCSGEDVRQRFCQKSISRLVVHGLWDEKNLRVWDFRENKLGFHFTNFTIYNFFNLCI